MQILWLVQKPHTDNTTATGTVSEKRNMQNTSIVRRTLECFVKWGKGGQCTAAELH